MFKRKNVVSTRESPRNVPARGPPARGPQASPTVGSSDMSDRRRRASTAGIPNPLIRPSLVDSVPCISTGSRSLDKALGHGGVPLGTSTLIEEHGTTDFSAAILKSGAAVAVTTARAGAGTVKSRVICLGLPDWSRASPNAVDPSKHRSTQSTSASASTSSQPTSSQPAADRMRIAWRYAKYTTSATDSPNAYCPDVDFKATLHPAPQANEVTYLTGNSSDESSMKLQTCSQQTPRSELVRVLLPSFSHPAAYTAACADPKCLSPFLAGSRSAVQAHGNAVAFVSISLQLYPRSRAVIAGAELLADTCIELEPFDSGDEKVQGFSHINRTSKLSDRGQNVEQRRELSFKLGRYQFEVTPYAIPVEVEAEIEKSETDW